METFEVIAESREVQSKGASRRLRRAGQVPGILYGANKTPAPISILASELKKHLEHEPFYSHVLTIKLGDQVEQAVLKDVQRHPSKPIVLHVDFLRVDAVNKIYMQVPLHFINEENCVAIKQEGGIVSHLMTEVEVHCLAKDLPEYIEIDLANLHIGDTVLLSNLTLPEGVELPALHDAEHDLPVVALHKGHEIVDDDDDAVAED